MAYEKKHFSSSVLKMIEALINLLQYSPFLDINVKQLCLTAGVNRTTFYDHYDNTFELLADAKNYMVSKFLSSYDDGIQEKIESGEFQGDLISAEYLLPYLHFIKENRVIYETYIKNSLSLETDEYFDNLIEHVSKPLYERRKKSDNVSLIYLSKFYIDGITSIVKLWIKRGFKESEEYICSIIIEARSS